jgi:hypothetical protein
MSAQERDKLEREIAEHSAQITVIRSEVSSAFTLKQYQIVGVQVLNKNAQVDVLRREADDARRQQQAASQALITASQMAVATTRQQRTSETTYVKSAPVGNVTTISSMEQSYAYGTNNGYTREQVCACNFMLG